jgi:dipeptidyl-peptidase 4
MTRIALFILFPAVAFSIPRENEIDPLLANKVTHDRVVGHWKANRFLYEVNGANGKREAWEVELTTGQKNALAALPPQGEHGRLEQIVPSQGQGSDTEISLTNKTEASLLVFWVDTGGARKAYGELAVGETRQQHTFEGHVWLLTTVDRLPVAAAMAGSGTTLVAKPGDTVKEPQKRQRGNRRPEKRKSAPQGISLEVRNHNLVLKSKDQPEQALTTDGTEKQAWQPDVHWSADGNYAAVFRIKTAQEHPVTIVHSSPKDQLQPKVEILDYLKPGDEIDEPTLAIVDLAKKQVQPVAGFSTPWSLEPLQWWEPTGEFLCLYNKRGHQQLSLAAVHPATGKIRVVAEEKSQTFIDYTNKVWFHFLKNSNEVVWMSERDGWCHLYLVDVPTGSVKHQITSGNWNVREVLKVDETSRTLEIATLGLYQQQDPYYKHYARVHLDSKKLTKLTAGDGTHEVEASPDGKWLLDRYSRVDQPTVTELRNAETGELVTELAKGNANALNESGWQTPERFVAKGRDGTTDIHGVILRPVGFESGKKYPVIENIYAGPQGFFTPKSFATFSKHLKLCSHGFIWVQIDGMGTNWRSKAFHDVCHKNLQDAGFPDRKLWLKAAAAKHPELDLTRVGIYGGSAGGQNAMRAVIDHADFYKAAVADCGCHDNRMDKIWWNEQWMGWPVDASYEAASNTTQAHRLGGKLLLTWGEVDSNVDPASSMQVVNALINANKDFEMLILPETNHGAGESAYAIRRRTDFFIRWLKP